ncbi:SidA/IucD/PvdA family monooxygenase [Streptomyces sp. NEAU-H22]|uniref:lysine N(6)-hydroxylase/L-ornithine N(5)-oxygenase family protein n=1 Tax=unclassified Streptomyces TaxID=2593676 RepID=UPI00224CE774|nr:MULTISPECIES: SidA/IucD/PvdA family monooxygenase [unclassified Streptomyces]MCX3288919.1 SidA/IucD/PvdA family monooxygenase [Streptomyces sp. NEAU-H22]WMD05090.1 SidA/IucD/PvdA family monooxygenase [Streptomyces sp. FXY-T5]
MESREPEILDVVGVGFGPSNLSLAVALEERLDPLTSAFFERQPSLGWHRGMLLPSAKMQVSFLKDLATFRNPASSFSFISYLHDVGRLTRFVNNQDFFPTRREFHDYLEWAESKLTQPVTYNSEVTAIGPAPVAGPGAADRVRVTVRDAAGDSRQVDARNVVISTGLVPRMPVGLEPDEFVWHSSQFLHNFRRRNSGELKRVAVVGGGQSAAEIVRFLYDSLPDAKVSAIVPSYGYSIADDTPFANQVFDPGAVDSFYHGSQRSKDAVWHYHKNTNYSVVDDEVIRGLYERAYEEDFSKGDRLEFLNLARVVDVKRVGSETRITVHSLVSEESYDLDVDVLVCATGYDPMDPAEILGELDAYCVHDAQGRHRVGRDYRLVTTPDLDCGIYLQGGTEHTHGLASSLLSNIAVRSGEIAHSIAARRSGAHEKGINE